MSCYQNAHTKNGGCPYYFYFKNHYELTTTAVRQAVKWRTAVLVLDK